MKGGKRVLCSSAQGHTGEGFISAWSTARPRPRRRPAAEGAPGRSPPGPAAAHGRSARRRPETARPRRGRGALAARCLSGSPGAQPDRRVRATCSVSDTPACGHRVCQLRPATRGAAWLDGRCTARTRTGRTRLAPPAPGRALKSIAACHRRARTSQPVRAHSFRSPRAQTRRACVRCRCFAATPLTARLYAINLYNSHHI